MNDDQINNEEGNNDNHPNNPEPMGQSLNNLVRRAMTLQQNNNENSFSSNFYVLKREFKQLIYSARCFSISGVILIILLLALIVAISKNQYTLESLESEEMVFIYFLIYLIVTILTWNIYLFFSIVVGNTEYTKTKNDVVVTADVLYFNPILFTFMIFYYNRTFVQTSFDILAWLVISSHYFINFCFSVNLHKYTALKISQITNFALKDNSLFLFKIRANYVLLTLTNFVFSYIIRLVIKDTEFMYKYFILLKVNFILKPGCLSLPQAG
jgi:hypothetical protein